MTAPDVRIAARERAEKIWRHNHCQNGGNECAQCVFRQSAFIEGAEWRDGLLASREEIAAEMKRHHFNANRLDNTTWGRWSAECACGWESPEFHYPDESIDAFYAHAAGAVLALTSLDTIGTRSGTQHVS